MHSAGGMHFGGMRLGGHFGGFRMGGRGFHTSGRSFAGHSLGATSFRGAHRARLAEDCRVV
jgi:hypothetical protein